MDHETTVRKECDDCNVFGINEAVGTWCDKCGLFTCQFCYHKYDGNAQCDCDMSRGRPNRPKAHRLLLNAVAAAYHDEGVVEAACVSTPLINDEALKRLNKVAPEWKQWYKDTYAPAISQVEKWAARKLFRVLRPSAEELSSEELRDAIGIMTKTEIVKTLKKQRVKAHPY